MSLITQIQIAAEAELELRKRRQERLNNYIIQKDFYKSHPLEYFHERLGIPPETINWQLLPEYKNHIWDGTPNPLVKILEAILNWKWVGVESATGTGKTFLGALIVFWFLECYDNSIVVTTAPKQDQLTLHIWKEISKLYPRFNKGELISLKLRMNPDKDDWVAVGFVAGVKANEDSATKAQGFHAEHMLIILEETPGIPQQIITAFQNTCSAPHNLIIAFGNPDHQLDNLHKFCMQDNVEYIRISGYDHPNVVLNNPGFIPGAISLIGIKRIISKYGPEHPLTLSRTRGISPSQAQDALIRLEWCHAAVMRYKELLIENKIDELKIKGNYALGVDVADSETGDKAAIAEGKGNVLLSVDDFQCNDSNQLGKRDVYLRMKAKNIEPNHVGIDGVGVGAGTVNALKELNLKIVNLKGNEAPIRHRGEEDFNNLRSQMWWQMREDLRNDLIAIPDDEELIADLVTPKFTIKNGKITVESKEDIKKRLGRSPNKGDAAVYWNWVRTGRNIPAKIVSKIL